MSRTNTRSWDNTQAEAEGWMISPNLRITYYGLSSKLNSFKEATAHVVAKATAGSDYHIRALAVVAAQDLTAGLSWIVVSGNYGSFKAYLDTGEVFEMIPGDGDEDYSNIVKVDVAEVKLNFPNNKHGDEWDVTHIGCWYDDGSYEGPASGRQAWLDNIDHEDDLVRATRASLVLKPYTVTVTAQVPVWCQGTVMAPNIEEAKQMVDMDSAWTIQSQDDQFEIHDGATLSNVETEVELLTDPVPAPTVKSTVTNHPGLKFDFDRAGTQIGVVDAPAAVNLRDWSHLSDDDGIKLYGSDALLSFIQRIVDPSCWQYLTQDERTFLRQAAAG
jgi:hypothetical protein